MKAFRFCRQLALTLATCIVASASQAGNIQIDDKAGVLGNKQQLESAASAARFNVHVLTRDNMLSDSGLDNAVNDAARFAGKNSVAVGVDTKLRHLHIAAQDAGLSKEQVDAAQRTAGTRFKQGDWAGGMAAAISELGGAAGSAPAAGAAAGTGAVQKQNTNTAGQSAPAPARKSGGIPWGLILLAGGAFLVFRMFMNRKRAQAGNAAGGYNQQAGGPPPPPGGYPQQQQGGGGLGGMGGGLLGGLGGGLLGYQLGRNSGNQGDGGNAAGGAQNSGADAGGGFVSGDSGGGDFGDSGGGDFGGGDSGDF